MMEMYSQLSPLFVLCQHVFGHQHGMPGAADQLVLLGISFGRDQGENYVSIRRRHGNPAAAGFIVLVDHDFESKFLHVKLKAAILIPNEDVYAEQTKIRVAAIKPNGRCHGGTPVFHRKIISGTRPVFTVTAAVRRLRYEKLMNMENPSSPLQPSFAGQFAREWVEAWNSHDLERILAHYDEDVILTSPVALKLLNNGDGVVRGKAALRQYFLRGIQAFPNRRFDLIDVLWGVETVVVYYGNNVRGSKSAEVMLFSAEGKIRRVWANYDQ